MRVDFIRLAFRLVPLSTLLVLAMAPAALSQEPCTTAPLKVKTVSGRLAVLEAGAEKPVTKAVVTLFSVNSERRMMGRASASDTGEFFFPEVKGENFILRIEPEGMPPVEVPLNVKWTEPKPKAKEREDIVVLVVSQSADGCTAAKAVVRKVKTGF